MAVHSVVILHNIFERRHHHLGNVWQQQQQPHTYDICVWCGICQWETRVIFFSGRPFDSAIIQRLVQFRCKHGISISSSRRKANSISITCWPLHCSASGQQSGKDKRIFINFFLAAVGRKWLLCVFNIQMNYIIFWSWILSFVAEIHKTCKRNRCIRIIVWNRGSGFSVVMNCCSDKIPKQVKQKIFVSKLLQVDDSARTHVYVCVTMWWITLKRLPTCGWRT